MPLVLIVSRVLVRGGQVAALDGCRTRGSRCSPVRSLPSSSLPRGLGPRPATASSRSASTAARAAGVAFEVPALRPRLGRVGTGTGWTGRLPLVVAEALEHPVRVDARRQRGDLGV